MKTYSKTIISYSLLSNKRGERIINKLFANLGKAHTITAGRRHTIGLKSDGTVVAVGDNKYRQCDVSDWYDIVDVAAANVHMATNTGNSHSIGL